MKFDIVITDTDGCLTDNRIYYGFGHPIALAFNLYDTEAFVALRELGVPAFMLSGSISYPKESRARDLGLILHHAKDKFEWARLNLGIEPLKNSVFMGNDIDDIRLLEKVGFPACPADAHPYVRKTVNGRGFIATKNGGYGAFRELVDHLIINDLL